MNSLDILKQLLETAICASKQDLIVFDFAEDDIHGLAVAEKEDGEFQIVIIPTWRIEKTETVEGKRDISAEVFDIYVPKYDDDYARVGAVGNFYTDIKGDPAWSFKAANDVAVKVLSWVAEYKISIAVNSHAEYLWFSESQDMAV
jgi:hypothetical protein